MRAFLRCVMLLLAVSQLHAVTTVTGGGTLGTATLHYLRPHETDPNQSWWIIEAINVPGHPEWEPYYLRHEGSAEIGPIGTEFAVTHGQGYVLRLNTHTPFWTFSTSEFYLTFTVTAPPHYKITITIPANDTEGLIRYHIYQGETFLQEIVTEPGAGPQIIQYNDLPSNQPVVIKEVSYVKEMGEDPLNPGHYIVLSSVLNEIRTVSSGTPTEAGVTASTPLAPKPTPAPIIKTAPAVAPTAPTPTAVPSAHVTHVTVNNPAAPTLDTPSGSTAATKEDIENQTNKLVTAAHNSDLANNTAANAVIESLNSVGQTSQAGSTAVVDAVNKVAAASSAQAKRKTDQHRAIRWYHLD